MVGSRNMGRLQTKLADNKGIGAMSLFQANFGHNPAKPFKYNIETTRLMVINPING
jgi:hypothetical protein